MRSTYAARTPATRCPTTSATTTRSSSSAARWERTTTRTPVAAHRPRTLVRDAAGAGVPALGICLGHQLRRRARRHVGTQPARPAARRPADGLDSTRRPTTRCSAASSRHRGHPLEQRHRRPAARGRRAPRRDPDGSCRRRGSHRPSGASSPPRGRRRDRRAVGRRGRRAATATTGSNDAWPTWPRRAPTCSAPGARWRSRSPAGRRLVAAARHRRACHCSPARCAMSVADR